MATPQVRPTGNSQPGGDDRTSDDGARGDLASRRFSPLTFEFNAARDLRFTQRLTHGAVWRDHGWAHPAWLASATNAIVWHNVDFATQETWANAGLAVHQLEPIADGSTITLTGGIRELFDGGRSRFAVAALTAWVDEVAVASLDNTFVYETLSSDEVRA